MMAWVGIDVSKKDLVAFLISESGVRSRRTVVNTAQGWRALVEWVGKVVCLQECHFCMESTGVYSFGIASFLAEEGLFVSVVNPRNIKHFAVAKSLKCKTDKADSICIAEFARTIGPKRWHLTDAVRREICQLRQRIKQLEKLRNMESNRLENSVLPAFVKDQIEETIRLFDRQAEESQERIGRLMPQCADALTVYEAISKINGIGHVCALHFASELDITSFEDASKVPAFFGISPRVQESGQYKGRTRITKAGDGAMRSDFYSATKAATRHNPVLKDFYEGLISRGLAKRQARVAVARKMMMYCWGVGRHALLNRPITYPGGIVPSRCPWKKRRKKETTLLTL